MHTPLASASAAREHSPHAVNFRSRNDEFEENHGLRSSQVTSN
jgi:hypothetical protein